MTTNLGASVSRPVAQVKESILVKDRDAAQLSTIPLAHVLGELGVDGFEKGPNKGQFPRRAYNGALLIDIADCLKLEKFGPGEDWYCGISPWS